VQMGENRNTCRLLVGKPDGRSPLGRPRLRCVDNIRKNLAEIGWDGIGRLDWSGSGQVQVESSCEFGNEPSSSIRCWETIECYTTRGLSGSAQLHRVS
jgi:hypothetical protein